MTLVCFHSFSVSVGAGQKGVNSYSLNFERTKVWFSFDLNKRVVSEMVLAYLGSVSVQYFSATVFLYFSVVL